VGAAVNPDTSEKYLDVVIWTELKSDFEMENGVPFSVDAAVTHIIILDQCGQAKAAEYVWCAPKYVETNLRDALQQEPWFSQAKPLV
jgi:hypothetical protein